MEQFTRLVKLLQVRRIKVLADHGYAVPADHFGEHVLERVARRLEMPGVQRPEGSIRAVADPLRAIFEQAPVHRAVRGDHPRQPESGLVKYLLDGTVPCRDG